MAISATACSDKNEQQTTKASETTTEATSAETTASESTAETTEATEETTTEATTEATAEETTEATTEETSSETVAETVKENKENDYTAFLEDFKAAYNAKNDVWYYGPGIVDDGNLPPETKGLLLGETEDTITYTLSDLDKDGQDELIIGSVFKDQEDGSVSVAVTGLVTKIGSEYKIVEAGWSRSFLSYTGNGYFINSGSGGAALHFDSVYKYDGASKDMQVIAELTTEYQSETEANYTLFEGQHASCTGDNYVYYESENASCRDEEAQTKFNEAFVAATSNTNELADAEWITFKLAE